MLHSSSSAIELYGAALGLALWQSGSCTRTLHCRNNQSAIRALRSAIKTADATGCASKPADQTKSSQIKRSKTSRAYPKYVDGAALELTYLSSDVYTLEQLSHVVDSSAACNIARLGSEVNWYEWDTFLHHFKKIPGISKRHHFVFASDKPGMVLVSDGRSSEVHEVNILKFEQHGLSMATLQPMLPRGGLSGDRQMYLYKKIRQFVPLLFRTSFVLLSTSDLRLTLFFHVSKP